MTCDLCYVFDDLGFISRQSQQLEQGKMSPSSASSMPRLGTRT
jgi:hypothetical protein